MRLAVIIAFISIFGAQGQQGGRITMFPEYMPEFPGGEHALHTFLVKNIRYPKEARERNINGTVVAQFIIDTIGSVDSVRILRSLGGGCDEEVIRVVRLMPRWRPGMLDGKEVNVWFTLPVTFALSGDPINASVLDVATFDRDGYSLTEYLRKNLRYPKSAQKKNIRGVVVLRLTVTKTGQVKNVKIVKGLSSECDKEAVRVVRTMPKWQPARENGIWKESETMVNVVFPQ